MLGIGGFGTVIKAVRRDTGRAVALKAIRKCADSRGGRAGGADGADGGADGGAARAAGAGGSGSGVRGARTERDVLSAVQHPFVVQTPHMRHSPHRAPPTRCTAEPVHHVRRRFVVQLHSAFQTQHHLYLVIDYCGGVAAPIQR